jgi:LmbE family N-acetylglucosaminyl deacetylase
VLLAHPDDEFFCAGLLAAAVSRNIPVHLVYWTRGEGSGSARRQRFWRRLPRAWHYRAGEARRAARILGASSVAFLGGIDPASTQGLRAPEGTSASWVEKIGRLRVKYAPDLLLTHGSNGEYGHPAHQRLHEITREAATLLPACPWVTFAATRPGGPAVRFLNRDDAADYVFDSRPFFRRKMEIVRTHRSQAGVLESLVEEKRISLAKLIRLSRFEGYRTQGAAASRAAALVMLERAAGKSASEDGAPGPPV